MLTEGGGGVQEPLILADVICEQPLRQGVPQFQYRKETQPTSPFLSNTIYRNSIRDWLLGEKPCIYCFSIFKQRLPSICVIRLFATSEYLHTPTRWGLHYLGQFSSTVEASIPMAIKLLPLDFCISLFQIKVEKQAGSSGKGQNCKMQGANK